MMSFSQAPNPPPSRKPEMNPTAEAAGQTAPQSTSSTSAAPLPEGSGPLRRLRIYADVEESFNLELVRMAAAETPAGAMTLDAGAGDCPYAPFFKHLRYESCDLFPSDRVRHAYTCDVQKLPMEDGRYDAILCVQVLDDLQDPQICMNGFARVLKPGGRVFISVPMATRLHGEPYHYFQFTKHGMALLAERAGMTVEWIHPRGGVFSHFAYLYRKLPGYMRRQLRFESGKGGVVGVNGRGGYTLGPITPIWNLCIDLGCMIATPFFSFLFPWLLRPFDVLDREKAFTLGYNACLRKP